MPIYIGSTPIDDILSDVSDYDQVYLGSNLVWPPIEFPFTVLDSNVTDAEVPEGATGCWVNLHGGGEAGGNGGHDEATTATGSASGGAGGGGGAVIDKFFIWVEDLPSGVWSLIKGVGGTSSGQDGTASRFICGAVDLQARGGAAGAGGTASAAGLTAGYYNVPLYNGSNTTTDADRAGAGGGKGGNASWTGDNAGTGQSGSGGNATTGTLIGHAAGKGGNGGNGAGGGNSLHWASGGGGGGGGGAYDGGNGTGGTSSAGGTRGVGGDGRAEVIWVNDHVLKERTYRYTPGAWSLTVPSWAQNGWKIDVAMWGGGKGGTNGTFGAVGVGGRQGSTASQTITVGTEVVIGGTLSGTVGAAGASNAGNGGNTTCTQLSLTAAGATTANTAQTGLAASGITIGGVTYPGGAESQTPGAGGRGGNAVFGAGAAGGQGLVIVRIREV